jgi:hypothetical protein
MTTDSEAGKEANYETRAGRQGVVASQLALSLPTYLVFLGIPQTVFVDVVTESLQHLLLGQPVVLQAIRVQLGSFLGLLELLSLLCVLGNVRIHPLLVLRGVHQLGLE